MTIWSHADTVSISAWCHSTIRTLHCPVMLQQQGVCVFALLVCLYYYGSDIIVLTMQENNPYSNCWEDTEMDGSRSLHIFMQQGYALVWQWCMVKKQDFHQSYWEAISYIYIVAHADIVVYSLHLLDSLWPYCFLGCVNHHIILCMESSYAVAIK